MSAHLLSLLGAAIVAASIVAWAVLLRPRQLPPRPLALGPVFWEEIHAGVGMSVHKALFGDLVLLVSYSERLDTLRWRVGTAVGADVLDVGFVDFAGEEPGDADLEHAKRLAEKSARRLAHRPGGYR